jgi:hypothetical protein
VRHESKRRYANKAATSRGGFSNKNRQEARMVQCNPLVGQANRQLLNNHPVRMVIEKVKLPFHEQAAF